MKQNLKMRSANLAQITMDGQEIGLLQNVRMSEDYGPDAASGIGQINPAEYVPSMARYNISASKMALRSSSLYKMGIVPENGEAALEGNVFDIEVYDKATGEVIRKYLDCSYASGDIEVQKHAVIAYNCQFNALDVAGTM